MARKRILLVDDEVMPTQLYMDELLEWPKKWEVKWARSVDEALEMVEESQRRNEPFDLAILDVMMPTGSKLTSEQIEQAGDGMNTGLVLRNRIKIILPDIKFLFLTNVRNAKLLASLWELEPERVRHKARTLPSELVDKVDLLIGSSQ